MDADDYDFEAILETLSPVYEQEGATAAAALLHENAFPPAMIETIVQLLVDLHDAPADYFDG